MEQQSMGLKGGQSLIFDESLNDKAIQIAELSTLLSMSIEKIVNVFVEMREYEGYSGKSDGALVPFYSTMFEHITTLTQFYTFALIFILRYQEQLDMVDSRSIRYQQAE